VANQNSEETDQLLAAVSNGDRSALGKLMQRHLPYLRKVVEVRISRELSSRIDVSDVVQETQMVVMRRIQEFAMDRPTSFRVWLRSRAIEQLIDQYRRHVGAAKRSVRREQGQDNNSSMAIAHALVTDNPGQRLRRAEIASRVRELIDDLRENDREILALRHGEGLSNNETAETLQISVDTASKRYGRALRRLVEKVSHAGLETSLGLDNI